MPSHRADYGVRDWWGTLWRLTVILLLVLTTAIVAVVIIGIVYDSDQNDAFFDILIVLAAAVMLETIMLYITHRINKRNYRKTNEDNVCAVDFKILKKN